MAIPPVVDALTNLANESSAVAKINANAQRAADAIADALSTTDTTQNTMNVPLDMNSQRILNLPPATFPNDPLRLQDIGAFRGPIGPIGPPGTSDTSTGQLISLGFRGLSTTRPLSTVFPTLVAAKLVYPRATSLSEETDGHAVQLLIDIQAGSGGICNITLPDGATVRTSFTIKSGSNPTVLWGRGCKLLQVTPGADGWHHGTADSGFQTVYGSTFSVQGVGFECLGIGGTALVVEQDPSFGSFVMRDVRISGNGNQTTNYWVSAVKSTGCSLTTWNTVSATGINQGNINSVNDAFVFTHDATRFPTTGSYIFRFSDVDAYYYKSAYVCNITRPLEGFWIIRGNSNDCVSVLTTNNTYFPTNNYRAPQYFVLGHQCECYGTFFTLNGVSQAKIKDCLLIVKASTPGKYEYTDYTNILFYVNNSSYDVEIVGNSILMLPNARYAYALSADGAAQYITMKGNHFQFNTNAGFVSAVNFGPSTNSLGSCREYDNMGFFNRSDSSATGTADRLRGNFSQASIEYKLLAAGQGDVLDSINPLLGRVKISGSRVVTPNATTKAASITIPPFTLSSVPIAMLTLGDTANVPSTGDILIQDLSNSYSNSVGIVIPTYTGSAGRRVNFTLTDH